MGVLEARACKKDRTPTFPFYNSASCPLQDTAKHPNTPTVPNHAHCLNIYENQLIVVK